MLSLSSYLIVSIFGYMQCPSKDCGESHVGMSNAALAQRACEQITTLEVGGRDGHSW